MEQKEYEAIMDMVMSDGWKSFIGSVKELEEIITQAAVDNAVTNDQWQYCRGQTHQLRSVLGYEEYVKLSFEAQQRAEAEDLALDSESINVDLV